MDVSADNRQLLCELVQVSRQFDGTASDAERNCWMAVHQYVHGVLPSEYDIREIDEELYLAVLALRKRQDEGRA
ncbi:MAG: hypothetical protein ACKO0M_11500 [Cyanobium sp.]